MVISMHSSQPHPMLPNETSAAYRVFNVGEMLSHMKLHAQPRVIARLGDCALKVVRLRGDFLWRTHAHADMAFYVVEGEVRLDFRSGALALRSGELAVVPKGVEHKPYAASEVKLLLIDADARPAHAA
jgi:mannose-6-phosphate isomerase-like protein (cupin superfamily)